MINATINVNAFGRWLLVATNKQTPFALSRALNETVVQARTDWQKEIRKVFDRPVSRTVRSPRFKKSTKQKLVAEVFIQNTGPGTVASKYLLPEVVSGPRREKGFERKLEAQKPQASDFYVPTAAVKRNAYGNVSQSTIKSILGKLNRSKLRLDAAPAQTAGAVRARRSRARRKAKAFRNKGYFILAKQHGKLSPGVVYERVNKFNVRTVFVPLTSPPTYRKRFDVAATTLKSYRKWFAPFFRREYEKALRTARK